EVVQRREISERTAELVDTEVKRILGDAYERAKAVLLERRAALDRLAAALLERETLDREEVEMVVAGKPLPPVPPPPAAPAAPSAWRPAGPSARQSLFGSRQPLWYRRCGPARCSSPAATSSRSARPPSPPRARAGSSISASSKGTGYGPAR